MESVTTDNNNPGEDETKFASRVLDASRVCRHLSRPVELDNAYLQGLQAFNRARVQEHVRNMLSHERKNIVRVRQVALAKEKSQCTFKKKEDGQETLLINAPEAGASPLLHMPFTPSLS